MSGGIFDLLGIKPEGNGVIDAKSLVKQGVITPEEGLLVAGLKGADKPLVAPVDPGKDFREYISNEGGFKGFFGSAVNPILSRAIFNDEFGDYKTAKADYATQKALFDIDVAGRTQRAKDSAGDAQDEALAAPFLDKDSPHYDPIRGLHILSSGAKPADLGNVTVKEGEQVWSGYKPDKLLYDGGPRTQANPAAVESAERTFTAWGGDLSKDANGDYNNPEHARLYGDLIASYEEPVTEMIDEKTGAKYTQNNVTLVRQAFDALNSQPAGSAPQTATGSGSNPNAGAGTGALATQTGQTAVGAALSKEDGELAVAAPEKLKFYRRFGEVLNGLGEWNPDANEGQGAFELNQATQDLYGPVQGKPWYPKNWNGLADDNEGQEWFNTGDGADALAKVYQLSEMLAVDERGKLKGQGQITEGETEMLRTAVTRLLKRGVHDELAMEEFTRVYNEFMKGAGAQEDILRQFDPENPAINDVPTMNWNQPQPKTEQTPARPQTERVGRDGQPATRTNFSRMSDDAFIAALANVPAGTVITDPDGEKRLWDGEKLRSVPKQ